MTIDFDRIPRARLPALAARHAQGRAAHPHRGLARTRVDLQAGAAQRRAAALCRCRSAAQGLCLHRSAELPRHLLRRGGCAAEGAGLLRHGLGLLRARRRRPRGACRAVLRPADAHRSRRADRSRHRRPGTRLPARACRVRHQREADPVFPAPPQRRGRLRHAGAGAALAPPFHRRRPGQRRARQPAGEVRARVREVPRARPACRRPCRRGGAAGLHRKCARCARRSNASITACVASKVRRWSSAWRSCACR